MATPNPLLQPIIDLYHQGQNDRAAHLCDRYLDQHPNDKDALYLRAMLLIRKNKLAKAAPLLRKAVNLDPTFLDAMIALGKVRTKLGRVKGAARILWRATKLDNNCAEAFHGLGVLYQQLGKLEKSLRFYKKAAALSPNEFVYSNIGHVEKGLGNFAAATEAFHHALTLNPQFAKAYQSLGSLKQYRFNENDINKMNELLGTAHQHEDKCALHFSLGKAYDDEKNYCLAFEHITAANQLTRATIEYSAQATEKLTNTIIATFTHDLFKNHVQSGQPSDAPIFIVSMPRSGSTLVEQILASHSLVFGGNELPDLEQIWNEAPALLNKPVELFDYLKTITNTELTQLGNAYLERVSKRYKTSKPFFTDKMPFNFHWVGFIQLILPNAKIVHVKRNPIDTCLGCYKLPFNDHHEFTYDLAELGHYYCQYVRLIQHWHQVLPNKLIEIEYEALVNHQEQETRKLLHACGLPWEETCLQFYNTKREVITESAGQVRQPIYKHAVAQWQHYESFITPLLDSLKPVL